MNITLDNEIVINIILLSILAYLALLFIIACSITVIKETILIFKREERKARILLFALFLGLFLIVSFLGYLVLLVILLFIIAGGIAVIKKFILIFKRKQRKTRILFLALFLGLVLLASLSPYLVKLESNRQISNLIKDLKNSTKLYVYQYPSRPFSYETLNGKKTSPANFSKYAIFDKEQINKLIELFQKTKYEWIWPFFTTSSNSGKLICIYDEDGLEKDSFTIEANILSINSSYSCYQMDDINEIDYIITQSDFRPESLMFHCYNNLKFLCFHLNLYANQNAGYPSYDKWYDIISEYMQVEPYKNVLKCPSAESGRCNYAINPNCTIDSPSGTVLLFESKPGWNQYGGAELLDSQRHTVDGVKGCNVLLHDIDENSKSKPRVIFVPEDEIDKLQW